MVQYISPGRNLPPVKKSPFVPSCEEWATLANETHDIKPTNRAYKGIIQDESWVKET
jgi:hypothetical protein